jgi:hypothetical protein
MAKTKKIDTKPDFVEVYPCTGNMDGYICNKNGDTLGYLKFVKDKEYGSFTAKIEWNKIPNKDNR